jgi:hypothetical protein
MCKNVATGESRRTAGLYTGEKRHHCSGEFSGIHVSEA